MPPDQGLPDDEQRLRELLAVLAEERRAGRAEPQASARPPEDAELLTGPLLAGAGELGLPDGDLPTVDLRTLLAEMAALRAEIRAETRASRQLREQLGDQTDGGGPAATKAEPTNAEPTNAELTRGAATGHEAERLAARLLIDLADRLAPALEQARHLAARPPPARPPRGRLTAALTRVRRWRPAEQLLDSGRLPRVLARLTRAAGPAAHSIDEQETAAAALRALARGLELTWRRLDRQLEHLGVERLACVGRSFDPESMDAVEVRERPGLPDGQVLREITTGYRDAQGLIRPAEVVVTRQKPTQTSPGISGAEGTS